MDKQQILELVCKHINEKPTIEFRPGIDDVPVSGAVISAQDISSVVSCALDGWFTEHKISKEFIRQLCKTIKQSHGILCNSGSSADLLALSACRQLNNRKYVITCATAFPTTVAPIIQSGFIPLFIDINPRTLGYNIDTVLDLMNDSKRDIAGAILTHTLGFPFDVERLSIDMFLYNWLIEDFCDALGATIYGTPVGRWGDFSTVSFFPAHHITSGEGGAVFTSDKEHYDLLHRLSSWGRDCKCLPGQDNVCGNRFGHKWKNLPDGYDHKYVFTELGYNLKMTELQASLGLSQLQMARSFTNTRKCNFYYLLNGLKQFEGQLRFIEIPWWSNPSPFGFPITINTEKFSRKELIGFLEKNKIRTRPVFAGNITRQPMMDGIEYECAEALCGSDWVMERTFWIGVHPQLTERHLDYVIDKITDFMRGQRE